MVTKLRAACVARQKHAEIFFQSEIFGIAQSQYNCTLEVNLTF